MEQNETTKSTLVKVTKEYLDGTKSVFEFRPNPEAEKIETEVAEAVALNEIPLVDEDLVEDISAE